MRHTIQSVARPRWSNLTCIGRNVKWSYIRSHDDRGRRFALHPPLDEVVVLVIMWREPFIDIVACKEGTVLLVVPEPIVPAAGFCTR